MKKISIEQKFDTDLATLLRAREERYRHLDKFPELKNVTIVSEERQDQLLKQVRHIHLGTSIPAILIPLLPNGADTLVESSTFDQLDNTHRFEVIPDGGHDNIFKITGISRYYELEPNLSARNYEIEIKSRALFIGGGVEAAIGEIYSQNLKKDQKSIEHFIKDLLAADGESSSTVEDINPSGASHHG
ncbi:MAG: DUF2505 domain-containing protein [Leptospiraceae bacterium]|nr:DUF2505 domain-containing protein [Leptospiraceae bacterium]